MFAQSKTVIRQSVYHNGPAAIIIATALMALQDTLVKLFNEGLPIWQLFLLRSALVLPVLYIWARKSGVRISQAFDLWVLIRSVLVVIMYVSFYAALPILDLSVVAGVYYTAPLLIVVFSAILLRERVSRVQVLILLIAFIGVLVVLQPSGDTFSFAALIPLVSAICYGFIAVITRARIRDIDPLVLIISLNLAFVVIGAFGISVLLIGQPDPSYRFLLLPWAPLSWETLLVTAILSVISIGVHLMLARAYQLGPTTVVASLDYAYLIFAVLWSALLLGEFPDVLVAIGTAIIAAAGVTMVVISSRLAGNVSS